MSNGESGFIHVVKNEYALFTYRFVTAACCLLMSWWVFDLKSATQDMRKDFNASLIMNEARISKLEGAVSVIDSSVRMQSRLLETHENVIQSIWSRIIDLNARSNQKGNP